MKRLAAREAILGAARELIRRNGAAGTSIADVIARSGTSAGAIYHHFGSKERLVLEVGRSVMAAPLTMIMGTSDGLSPAELFDAAFAQVSADEGTAELLLQVWAGAKSDPRLLALLLQEGGLVKGRIVGFIGVWCAEHAPHADPDALASVLMSLITGYAVQRGLGVQVDPVTYRAHAVRLLEAALTEPAPHEPSLHEAALHAVAAGGYSPPDARRAR